MTVLKILMRREYRGVLMVEDGLRPGKIWYKRVVISLQVLFVNKRNGAGVAGFVILDLNLHFLRL